MRDNFTSATKSNLAFSANMRCVRPSCGVVTHIYDHQAGRIVNLHGHAAHLSAASTLGPRFDDDLTDAQRRHFNNGAWLCANCATLIDRLHNRDEYSIERLRAWQQTAMEFILNSAMTGRYPIQFDARRDAQVVALFYNELMANVLRDWHPGSHITVAGSRGMQQVAAIGTFRGPGNDRLAQQLSVRNRQLEIADILASVLRTINTPGAYRALANDFDSVITGYAISRQPFDSEQNQQQRQEWIEQDRTRHAEVCRLARDLDAYLSGSNPLTGVEW